MNKKRIIAIVLAVVLVVGVAATVITINVLNNSNKKSTIDPNTLIGDVNLNGVVNIADASLVQSYLSDKGDKPSADIKRLMNVTGDGDVSIEDVTEIQRYACDYECDSLVGMRFAEVYPMAVQTNNNSGDGSLKLNAHDITMGVNENYQLIAESDPGSTPVFKSTNEKVASVTPDGKIIPKTTGNTEIICTLGDMTDTCKVTVCPAATSLTLNETELYLGIGDTFELVGTVDDGAAAYVKEFSSSDGKVATVTADGGLVTAVGNGEAVITCKLLNGITAECTVSVLPPADSIAFKQASVSIGIGATYKFEVSVPEGTSVSGCEFYSENPEIVEIDQTTGIAKGIQEGETRVYVQAGDMRADANVTVTPEIRSIMVSHLQEQVGNGNSSYVQYINAHSDLNVSEEFPWCAIFGWCSLNQFAEKAGLNNPIEATKYVSDIAIASKKLGALHVVDEKDYIPQPGDLFTTAAGPYPEDGGRDHIGYIESVETDENGNVLKVHTIEGNFSWETNGSFETRVARSEWVPGEKNEFGSGLCEYINIDVLFAAQ